MENTKSKNNKSKSTNLFIEYNTFLKKEDNIYKNHTKGIIQSVSEGFQEIDNFDLCSVWDEVYISDTDAENNIKELVDNILDQLVTDHSLKYFVTGPLIRSVIIPTEFNKVRRDIYIYPLKTQNVMDVTKYLNTKLLIDQGSVLIGAINKCKIVISKEPHVSIPRVLFGLKTSDRMCYYNDNILISAMFALDFYKNLSIYRSDSDNLLENDPYLNIPRDILNIYKRDISNSSKVQKLIDMIDVNGVSSLKTVDVEDVNICFDEKRKWITPIEYALYKFYNENNPMFRYNYRIMVISLNSHKYVRSPVAFAKAIGIEKLDENLFKILDATTYKYKTYITSNNLPNELSYDDVESIIHNINMAIIDDTIKNDDVYFMKFLDIIGYEKRILYDVSSKTGKKVLKSILDNNARLIMTAMVDSDSVADYNKLYLILMSENIDLIDNIQIDNLEELLLNYIDDIVKNGLLRSFYYLLKLNSKGVLGYRNDNGDNVLHILTGKDKSYEMLKLVMKINEELINEKNNSNITPLHLLAKHGLNSCIELVLGLEETNYDITDSDGNTFLHYLCKYGHIDCIKTCARRILSILDKQNNMNETPIIVACKNKHEEIYYILKGYNANLSLKDNIGNTVYHYICLNGICCSLMIPSIENNYGYSPYDYCKIARGYYNFI